MALAPRVTRVEGDGFALSFESRGDYLRAQVDGQHDTFEISLAYWTQVARECRARGARRVLVVENIAEAGDPLIMEPLLDALVELGFRDIRLAFVDLVDEHLSAMEHGEILAIERGLTGRVFAGEADAVSWLRHGVDLAQS